MHLKNCVSQLVMLANGGNDLNLLVLSQKYE